GGRTTVVQNRRIIDCRYNDVASVDDGGERGGAATAAGVHLLTCVANGLIPGPEIEAGDDRIFAIRNKTDIVLRTQQQSRGVGDDAEFRPCAAIIQGVFPIPCIAVDTEV